MGDGLIELAAELLLGAGELSFDLKKIVEFFFAATLMGSAVVLNQLGAGETIIAVVASVIIVVWMSVEGLIRRVF